MEYQEYIKFDVAQNGNYELPEFFWTDEGKFDPELGLNYLDALGYILNHNIEYPTYDDNLLNDYPEVYRMLKIIEESQKQSLFDDLVAAGYVDAVLVDGEVIYTWTAEGAEVVNEILAERQKELE